MPGFLKWLAGTFFKDDVATGTDAVLQFLQANEFSFPRTLFAVEALVRHKMLDADFSYTAYVTALECWFRPPWMKELDEAGIPLPLAERLSPYVGNPAGRHDAMNAIRAMSPTAMQRFDAIDHFVLDLALAYR